MQKILLVDDDLDTIVALKDALEFDGYAVETAMNGIDALKKAESVDPDIILLDVMMPGEDGFSVCYKLKDMKKTRDIPVIMLTAKSLLGDIEKALTLGAASYVVKPFDMEELTKKITTYIRKPQP